jgi:hypothetical protein
MAIVGMGTGMLMQNIVLAVQNTVSVENIGAASSIVAFFRTFGGAIGVSVLGSILASRVGTLTKESVSALPPEQQMVAGKSLQDGLDLNNMPDFVGQIVRFAYGDATGRIFLVAAVVAIVTLVAVSFIPNRALRTTIDIVVPEADEVNLEKSASR